MNKKLLGFILFIAVLAMNINIGIAADVITGTDTGVNAVVSGSAVDYPAEGGTVRINTATGVVTGYAGAVTKVDIPSAINGTAVRIIAGGAFKNCKSLAKITLPASVVTIAGDAFTGCDKTKLVFGVVKGSTAESFAAANGYKTETVASVATEITTEATTNQIKYGAKRYKVKGLVTVRTDGKTIEELLGLAEEDTTEETTEEEEETETSEEEKVLTGDVRVTIGSSVISVGDEEFTVDAAPYIQPESNSTLVPLRFAAVAISGGDVDDAQNSHIITWYADTKTAAIDTGDKTVSFTAGSNIMDIDGIPHAMENGVKAEITGGRMFIPLRALGEAMDVNVYWDAENKTALYSTK